MADSFTWNEPNATDRATIMRFLQEAEKRIDAKPGSLPLDARYAGLTIAWLKLFMDRKPSQVTRD